MYNGTLFEIQEKMKFQKPCIYIVDENIDVSNQLKLSFIEQKIHSVRVFQSTIDCLNSEQINPDIIYVEFRMNHLNGIQAIKLLRRKWKRSIFILKGVSDRQEKRINKRKYGISKTIIKDTDLNELVMKAIIVYRIKYFRNIGLNLLIFCSICFLSYFLFKS